MLERIKTLRLESELIWDVSSFPSKLFMLIGSNDLELVALKCILGWLEAILDVTAVETSWSSLDSLSVFDRLLKTDF